MYRFWKSWRSLTGGRSFVATDADALGEIFSTIDALEKSPVRGQILTRYDEHFAIYASLALTLLLVGTFSASGEVGAIAMTTGCPHLDSSGDAKIETSPTRSALAGSWR